jgi:hypothetical protein
MIEQLRRGREQMVQARAHGPSTAAGLATPAPPAQGDRRGVEDRLRAQVAELEASQRRMADELVEVEQQLSHFAVLFAALRQLHEAATRGAALDAIQEIVVNLVGSEELAVLEAGPGGALAVVRSMGVDPGAFAGLRAGEGPFGEAVSAGELLAAPDARLEGLGHARAALVPLRAGPGGPVTGAIAVQELLRHKQGLTPRDREVLELLQTHAAAALRATAPRAGPSDAGR